MNTINIPKEVLTQFADAFDASLLNKHRVLMLLPIGNKNYACLGVLSSGLKGVIQVWMQECVKTNSCGLTVEENRTLYDVSKVRGDFSDVVINFKHAKYVFVGEPLIGVPVEEEQLSLF